jgi:NIMA (never in mitosis gene a)-related kinase 1/4/5
MNGLYKKVLKGEYKPIPLQYSTGLRQVIDSMLMNKYQDRASVSDILSIPFIQKIGWQFGMSKEPNIEKNL